MAIANSRLSKLYYLYIYNTPLGVMTTNERIVFNVVALCLLVFTVYWSVAILPYWLFKVTENLYYYCTGNSLSVSLAFLLWMSRKLMTPLKLAVASNSTRIRK